MNIWLLFAVPVVVWIAVIAWLKPQGKRVSAVTRIPTENGWRASYRDIFWSGPTNAAGAYDDQGSGSGGGNCRVYDDQGTGLGGGDCAADTSGGGTDSGAASL